MCSKNIWRIIKTKASSKLAVFLKLCSGKTVHFSEQIISAEKYHSTFLHHMEDFVYISCLAVSLQGIGLSLEEALIFWRAEFTKLMDVDKVFYNKLAPPYSQSKKIHQFRGRKFLDFLRLKMVNIF